MKYWLAGFLFALLASASLAVVADEAYIPPGAAKLTGEPPPAEKGGLSATNVDGDYKVGPKDVLSIEVFGIPELTDVSAITASGEISFPLLGTVQVSGMTTKQIEVALEEALKIDYLQDPHVTVDIRDYQSQLVTVDGAIRKPGVYPLTGKTTFLQIIVSAGGLDTKLADYNEVAVFRKVEGEGTIGYIVDYEKVRDGELPDPLMRAGDVVVVAESGSKALWWGTTDFVKSVSAWTLFF